MSFHNNMVFLSFAKLIKLGIYNKLVRIFMKTLSKTEEDYLKALLHLIWESNEKQTGTNKLADLLGIKPASANNMLKKLRDKKLVSYVKYGKINLTKQGKSIAVNLIRKHRLWETFLYEKMDFSWDEVHEVAEQLEHIHSPKLINQLDKLLDHPKFDPHGDPIPNSDGEIKKHSKKTLLEINEGSMCRMVGVRDNTTAFLKYVSEMGLGIKTNIKVVSKQEFDNSLHIEFNGNLILVSEKFAKNIVVL